MVIEPTQGTPPQLLAALEACQWCDDTSCPFATDPSIKLIEEGGRTYCIYHAPAHSRTLDSSIVQAVIARHYDLRGIYFPAGEYRFVSSHIEQRLLNGCAFASGVSLTLTRGSYDLGRAHFLGDVSIALIEGAVRVNLDHAVCAGRVKVRARLAPAQRAASASGWSARSAHFEGGLDVRTVPFKTSLTFDHAIFKGALLLDDASFPQQTTFHRAHFGRAASPQHAEGGFRHARQHFKSNGHRDLEGTFYALEKRSQRQRLERWSATYWINRAYDEISEFGHNYVRPLVVFCLLQLLAYEAYAGLVFKKWVNGPIFDSAVAAFTLAQVVKPFELLGARNPETWFYTELMSGKSSLGLSVFSLIHSVASLTLATLFILALRWRFRRE